MDLATLLGLAAGLVILGLGIVSGGSLRDFIDWPSLLITLGGTIAATAVNHPASRLKSLPRVVRAAFRPRSQDPRHLVDALVGYADLARREGLLALETEAAHEADPFLHKALVLAAAGTDETVLRNVLETDLAFIEERHKAGAALLETAATYAPAFGLIGSVIGLVQMLRRLDSASGIGPAMATALLTTLYGLLLANLVLLPLAGKLKVRHQEEVLVRELVIEGILSIHAGDTPGLLEEKLGSFLAPTLRRSRGPGEGEYEGGEEE